MMVFHLFVAITWYVAVEYPPTEEIIANIEQIEMDIQKELTAIKQLLKKK